MASPVGGTVATNTGGWPFEMASPDIVLPALLMSKNPATVITSQALKESPFVYSALSGYQLQPWNKMMSFNESCPMGLTTLSIGC